MLAITCCLKSKFQFCSVIIPISNLFVYSAVQYGFNDKLDANMARGRI